MKLGSLLALLTIITVVAITSACHRQAEVNAATSELEEAFKSTTTTPQNASPATSSGSHEAKDMVSSALAAAHANDYAKSVITLQAAQRKPGVTAEQVMAMQNAMRAMSSDLSRRAVNGDAQARQQLQAIERTRSQ